MESQKAKATAVAHECKFYRWPCNPSQVKKTKKSAELSVGM